MSMGDNILAGDMLRSLVSRIERLKDEQDALGEDIKEIYAEAKSNGFDKTALGQVVTIRRKRAKDPQAFEERSATVDLYLGALDEIGTSIAPRAHTRARATTHSSGESRERQMPNDPAPAGSEGRKPEAPPQDDARKGPAETAAIDLEIPTYLRRGHPDCLVKEDAA